MAESLRADVCVIGAGPGGYVAALRAAQRGLSVVCIEAELQLGGTCLRVGCIPSKALLESSEKFHEARTQLADHGIEIGGVRLDLLAMMSRKQQVVDGLARGIDALFAKYHVRRLHGRGRLLGSGAVHVDMAEGGTCKVACQHVILATGSQPAQLAGIDCDGEWIGDSTTALSYHEVPGHLVLIGAGAIGLELGSVWQRLGARVTVVELLDRILPGMDLELARAAQRALARQGLAFRLGASVVSVRHEDQGCVVELSAGEALACDRVLVAVGRVPATAGLGLHEVGVALDTRGRVAVDERYRTSVAGVYAIGDLIAGPMLAHRAEAEGRACIEWLLDGYGHVDPLTIPAVVYTAPEVASVGLHEQQLEAEGIPFRVGKATFHGNGRARALGSTEGFVKVLAHAENDRLLGVHAIGPRVGDLIAEAAAAMSFAASAEDVARVCHPHPTLCEVFKEAALAAWDRPLHG